MAMKIRTNEKIKIKLMSKNLLPKELDDPVDDEINRLNDGRKRYLANYSQKIGISNEENLFLQSMQIDEEYGTFKKKGSPKKSNSESKAKKFIYKKKSMSQLLDERTDLLKSKLGDRKKSHHDSKLEKILELTNEVENSTENIDFQGLLMDQESFHLANAEQFKEIKNAMDRYYGS